MIVKLQSKASHDVFALASIDNFDLDSFLSELKESAPTLASGSYAFKWKYLLDNITSKYVDPQTTAPAASRKRAAYQKFMDGESNNARINERGYDGATSLMKCALHHARKKMQHILGDFTWDCLRQSRFSTGATDHRTRLKGDPGFKYRCSGPLTVSPSAYKIAYAVIQQTPVWADVGALERLKITDGNVFGTVPKDSDIDRTIGKEADMDMYCQLSVGSFLKHRLKKTVNVDLYDQTVNQRLALRGSLHGDVATLDFSNASNSISIWVVLFLLEYCDPEWTSLLLALRADKTVFTKADCKLFERTESCHVLQMFSSMGNGFTFELESAIFYCIAYGFCKATGIDTHSIRSRMNVFGDDLILPNEAVVPELFELFEYCGFQINQKKSFWEGAFRESCGKHYFNGVDVTPFYIRKPISNLLRVIWLLNSLRKWAYEASSDVCDPSVWKLWVKYSRLVPTFLHGGHDVESNDSLVTRHTPRKRLAPVTKSIDFYGVQGYLRWLQFGDTGVIPGNSYLEHTDFMVGSTHTIDDNFWHNQKATIDRRYNNVGRSTSFVPVNLKVKAIDAHLYQATAFRGGRIKRRQPYGCHREYHSSATWQQVTYYEKPLFSQEIGFIVQ